MQDTISSKLTTIAENQQRVYDAGYDKGKSEGYVDGALPMYYNKRVSFGGVVFPKSYELFIHMKTCENFEHAFYKTDVKSIKIKTDEESTSVSSNYGFRETTAEVIDLSESKMKFNTFNRLFQYASNLKSIFGELDASNVTNTGSTFNGDSSLEDVSFVAETIGVSIWFPDSSKLTKASITSIINGLSLTVTEQTLGLKSVAVNKAFETSEGANDGSTSTEWETLAASKPNWTIALS